MVLLCISTQISITSEKIQNFLKKWVSGLPYLMILAQDMSDMYLISKHSKILIKWCSQNSLKPKSCFQRAVPMRLTAVIKVCPISHHCLIFTPPTCATLESHELAIKSLFQQTSHDGMECSITKFKSRHRKLPVKINGP